jgi:hypothetical protein
VIPTDIHNSCIFNGFFCVGREFREIRYHKTREFLTAYLSYCLEGQRTADASLSYLKRTV